MEESNIAAPIFDFNSRPSARGDVYVGTKIPKEGLFQFTPLREGRQDADYTDSEQKYFNSRPSARGDYSRSGTERRRNNFNSRPSARGDDVEYVNYWQIIFQFTPLREGRLPKSRRA